jgi:hypothetical protein
VGPTQRFRPAKFEYFRSFMSFEQNIV